MEAFIITGSIHLTSFLKTSFVVLVLIVLVKYNWQRRWLYYYSYKLNGPSALPLIGCLLHLGKDRKDLCKILMIGCGDYPSIARVWIGHKLLIFNSNPEDLEIILNTHFNKGDFYKFGNDLFVDGLITADEKVWKRHRKIISPTFNTKILNSFIGIFYKKSLDLVDTLEKNCGKGQVDILYSFWRCTLDVVCESMCDVDSNLVTGQDQYLKHMSKIEELTIIRVTNPIFYTDFVWKYLNPYAKEWKKCTKVTSDFCKQIIEKNSARMKQYDLMDDNNLQRKRFLTHLNGFNKNGELSEQETMSELQTMLIAASETSAIIQSVILVILSIHQDVQEKLHQELHSVFGGTLREPTVSDLNNLEYLERVIKETMRLQPVVPFVLRYVEKTSEINSHTYPAGCNVVVPIIHLHRKPDIWEDPLTFNPDRFLPENSAKRHRCAYIPFSYGARNCIGLNYGMMSMKIIMSTILRHFKIISSNYKSIDEIQPMLMSLIAKPKNGCKVELQKR